MLKTPKYLAVLDLLRFICKRREKKKTKSSVPMVQTG